MNDLATWSQILSSLAVLGTLGYLAIQIRQNTEALHAQTRQALLTGSQAEIFQMVEWPQMQQNLLQPEPLTTDEYVRLHFWLVALLRAREFAWLQHRKGIMDDDLWETEKGVIAINLTPARGRKWWNKVGRHAFNPKFAQFVDATLEGRNDDGFLETTLNWDAD